MKNIVVAIVAALVAIGLAATPAAADTGPYLDFADWPTFAPGESTMGGTFIGPEGVPQVRYAWGVEDNPVTVCHWALQHYSWWTQSHWQTDLDAALAGADWLIAHQTDGRFEYHFAIDVNGVQMDAPWISALAQGEAMSLLVRAGNATGDPKYIAAAEAALAAFDVASSDGGVLGEWDGVPWYEEYPGAGERHVLNGFEFALIGLHDLAGHSPDAQRLFQAGVASLQARIATFDAPGSRSQFYAGIGRSVVAAPYPHVDAVLTRTLATITGDPTLAAWAGRWEGYLEPAATPAARPPVAPAATSVPAARSVPAAAASTAPAPHRRSRRHHGWKCRVGHHRMWRHGHVGCRRSRHVMRRALQGKRIRSHRWRCYGHAKVTCRRRGGDWVRARRRRQASRI